MKLKKIINILILLGSLTALSFAQTVKEDGLSIKISGQWSGSFDITLPDGNTQHENAFFVFEQKGQTVTGTAGASAEQQSPISEGKISGSRLQFKVNVRPGTVLVFDLVCNNDHLKGRATDDSSAQIEIDVVRVGTLAPVKSPVTGNLYDEILQTDKTMFDAFNERDLAKFVSFFAEDLEFYQDLTGLTNYRQNVETFKTNFAKSIRIRRELDLKSLEIYPLKDYGAMEIGTNRFYTIEPGQMEKLTAEVKFVHIWQKKHGVWKITRIISYGHRTKSYSGS